MDQALSYECLNPNLKTDKSRKACLFFLSKKPGKSRLAVIKSEVPVI
jgi:hypothetical protein